MGKPIYLDYNATTPIDPEVAEVMIPFIHSYFGNPSSSYSIGKLNRDAIEKARFQVADLINAKPEEILFTSCATESNNLAIHGFVKANSDKGKHIITSGIEHPSVAEVCKYLSSVGYEITYIPVNSFGIINPKDIENAVRPDTVLITLMHANNEIGSIQPISQIATIANKYKIAFHTDASQSVGKIETNVEKLGVNLLTIAGHKLYAPKGIGALYIKNGTKISNLLYGAGQEKSIRPGTENMIHLVAIGKACEIAKRDLIKNSHNMLSMRDRLLSGLKNHLGDKVFVNGDLINGLPNTLSVAFEGVGAHNLAHFISDDLFISIGSACHSGITEISSVLQAMRIDHSLATGTVRISTGKYTSEKEIDLAIKIISDAVINLSQK